MVALRRPKTFIPVIIIVAAIIVGVVAVKSRGSDNKPLATSDTVVNCPPTARADAAATKPGEPVSIDVLANDTDPDGDPLVFQILKTEGGTSAIDDGGTPTDSSDDRLQFTPDEPPPDTATIEYQALDPQGGFSSSTVAVYINPQAALPDGVHSASATDPVPDGTDAGGRCGATTPSTVVDSGVGPVGPDTSVAPPTTESSAVSTNATTGHHTTTTKKKSTSKATTTTAKKTTTTGGSPATTQPSQPTTTKKPTTTTSPHTTSPPPTTPAACGQPTDPGYAQCVSDSYHGHPPTTATPPTTA